MGIQLSNFVQKWTPKINQFLSTQIPRDSDQAVLAAAMSYSVDAGGKRLRPLLTLATFQTFGISVKEASFKATCALELMHTYSLIHDDLPAMDNDDLRRGKPTNHVKFGAGMATLAGDGLQALAFQWLVDNQLSAPIKSELALAMAKAAGPSGMAAGQADDIEFEGKKLDLSALQKLDRYKTGALIRYAVEAGLIMGEIPDDQRPYFLTFAEKFGAAFQIYDDILDVVGDEKTIGKPVHQDQQKNTYPNLLGLKVAYQDLQTTINQATAALATATKNFGIDTSLLADFCSYFVVKDEG